MCLVLFLETVDYLLKVENEFALDSQWTLVYEFVADRYRAVRQDIIIQQLKDTSTTYLFEKMICFYIKARFRLVFLHFLAINGNQ